MLTEFWQKIDTLDYILWEILSVSLQFIADGRKQWEGAVGFLHILSTDVQSILDGNKKVLLFYELNPLWCIGLGFNGASLMWGRHCRVQAIMHETYVNAQYVHCSGHWLNLVIVQMCSNTSAAKKFFDAAGQLPRFFSVSSQRDDFRSYMHRSATNSDTRSLLDILKTMDQSIYFPSCVQVLLCTCYLSSNITYSRSYDFQHEMGLLWQKLQYDNAHRQTVPNIIWKGSIT